MSSLSTSKEATSSSPLKGKPKSTGVDQNIRKQLAIYIKEAGGPFEFDKGGKPDLATLLKRAPYKDHPKRAIQNLVDSWKNKKYYQTTEEWLSKLYIPLILQEDESNSHPDSKTESKDESQHSAPPTVPKKATTTKPTNSASVPVVPKKQSATNQNRMSHRQQDIPTHGGTFFSTLEEARSFADNHYTIDVHKPEGEGHDMFCKIIPAVKSEDGKLQYTKIRCTYTGMLDLEDFPSLFKCFLVCNGKAILFMKPSVPSFLLNHYDKLLGKEKKPCGRTADETAIEMQAIAGDKSRQITTLLIEAPAGMSFNADFNNDNISPEKDQKIKLVLRETDNLIKLGKRQANQLFYPAHFQLHIVGTTKKVQAGEEDAEESLEDAFEGMNVSTTVKADPIPEQQPSSGTQDMETTTMETPSQPDPAPTPDLVESAALAAPSRVESDPAASAVASSKPGFDRSTEEDRKEAFKPVLASAEDRTSFSEQRRQNKKAKKLREARNMDAPPVVETQQSTENQDPNRTAFVANLMEAADASHAKTKATISHGEVVENVAAPMNMETESCDSAKLSGEGDWTKENDNDLNDLLDGIDALEEHLKADVAEQMGAVYGPKEEEDPELQMGSTTSKN